MNLVPESARHLEMTRARQMRVDTRDLAEALISQVFGKLSFNKLGVSTKITEFELTEHGLNNLVGIRVCKSDLTAVTFVSETGCYLRFLSETEF